MRSKDAAKALLASNSAVQQVLGEHLRVVRLSDVQERTQLWLWFNRIPKGSVSMLGGRQGTAKNLLVYDWMMRITKGKPWPDDPIGIERRPGSVILLEAEEAIDTTTKPRLIAAGADDSRIHIIEGTVNRRATRKERFVSLQSDMKLVEDFAATLPDLDLIVISPITSYLGDVNQNKNEQVRNEILLPLKKLAEDRQCAVILIKHVNKVHTNTDPVERIGGSAAWTEAMRVIMFAGPNPEEPPEERNPRRALFWVKFSLGPRPEPLSFKITVASNGAPYIRYLDDPIEFSASESLSGSRSQGEKPSKQERAWEWLREQLHSGPRLVRELNKAANKAIVDGAGFSQDAYERAKRRGKDSDIVMERKPNVNPAEWWIWLGERTAPDWYRKTDEDTQGAESPNKVVANDANVANVAPN